MNPLIILEIIKTTNEIILEVLKNHMPNYDQRQINGLFNIEKEYREEMLKTTQMRDQNKCDLLIEKYLVESRRVKEVLSV